MNTKINTGLFLLCVIVQAGFAQITKTNTIQRDLLKTASALERGGRFDLAADKFIELSYLNPRNISSYLGAKRCLLKVPDYQKLENFIYSLQKTHRDIRYEIDLAELRYISGDEKNAIKQWEKVVEENSKNHQAYSLVGNMYLQIHLYDKAIQLYVNARKMFNDEKLYVFELAEIYHKQGKHELMVEEYVRYLQYNKTQTFFIDSRIAAASDTKDAKNNIEKQLKRSLKNKNNDAASLYQLLGSFHLRAKEYKTAFDYFKLLESEELSKKEKSRPQNVQGFHLYKYVQVLLKDSQLELAEQALTLIIQQYPKSVYGRKAEFGIALLNEKQQRYPEAIAYYKRFQEKYPRTTEGLQALLQIGEIQYNILFDLDSASKTFENIIKNYKNVQIYIQAMEKLADCYIALNKLDDAKEALIKVREIAGGLGVEKGKNASLGLAQIEFYQGHPDKSIEILEEMLQAKPGKGVTDFAENDALELLLLLKSSSYDSLSIVEFGKAKLLNRQRQYLSSNDVVHNLLKTYPNTPVFEEANFLEHENLMRLSDYQGAVTVLSTIYQNEQSLNRDLALLLMAKIYEENLSDMENAEKYYEKVLVEFPHSIYLEETRQRIRQVISSREVL